ncbi:MAG: hypothetical protein EZS28_000641 [Streblomastix strix]|uniref:Reverse transcriptase domain-containing protein n=1 Tax=Streblomastix strix TaxID=222440 RepID=A0A5J4X9Q4_9EUKA|nr:MAG: hypothetical protein EZS28_000641 [Streblomastix strix]
MIIPFRGTKEQKEVYQRMLKEEPDEGKVMPIQQNQIKQWNRTYLIKKSNGTQRKILDASKLNKESEISLLNASLTGGAIPSQLNGLRNILRPQISISPHRSISKFNTVSSIQFNNNNYAYKTMPFGTKHSPIFFAQAIESILRQIKIHSQFKISNNCDDIHLIHQDKQILETQSIEIMRTLEQFGWIISEEKCETEPKQIIIFLRWILNLRYMNIKISEERKLKKIQALKDWYNVVYKSICMKIRQLAKLIDRLNFLRTQIKEAPLYLMELDKAKTQALKIKSWDESMIINRTIIRELKLWIKRIGDNQPESLINKTKTSMLTTDASPQGWGATLIYDNQMELIQHDCRSEKEAEMTANLQEDARSSSLYTFRQHNSSLRYLEIESEGIPVRKNITCILPSEKTSTTKHNPGKMNSTTDSLSRLCRSGDYTLKDGMIQMICKTQNYIPQMDIFATQYNKLINNYVKVDLNDLGTHFHNAFNYKRSKVKLYIHPQITSIKLSITENEIRQSRGNNNITELAGTIVVYQAKEFIREITFLWIIRENSGDMTDNERQRTKASTRQYGLLPSGPVADVGRDLLMRYMKMRGFSQEGVNLLFNGQWFNKIRRDFYSLALLWDWLDIEKITIEETMKKDAEVILTEVVAFHTRQNNSVVSAKSHKACLTVMLSLIYKENLASSTIINLIDKGLPNATILHRRYQNICNVHILFNHWGQSKQDKYLNNYDLQVKIASLLISSCFFRPNEIAEIRLKFSNVNKTKNQAPLRLASKQANAIKTLKKLFPKGTVFLLWRKGFNKPTTTKDISLQFTKLLKELKIIGASASSIRHSATTELAKLVGANDIARSLTRNPGRVNEKINQESQQRGEKRKDGGNKLLSSSLSETGQ